jgi:hypothetical protein
MEWTISTYGSSYSLTIGFIKLSVHYNATRSKDVVHNKNEDYYCIVNNQRLKNTFSDSEKAKIHCIKTAKQWLQDALDKIIVDEKKDKDNKNKFFNSLSIDQQRKIYNKALIYMDDNADHINKLISETKDSIEPICTDIFFPELWIGSNWNWFNQYIVILKFNE